jgi:hypothetical protein
VWYFSRVRPPSFVIWLPALLYQPSIRRCLPSQLYMLPRDKRMRRDMSIEPEKKLRLSFHGRIIDSLGIQMYQSPVAAVAELIANAWDADATAGLWPPSALALSSAKSRGTDGAEPRCPPPQSGKSFSFHIGRRWLPHLVQANGFRAVSSPATNRSGRTLEKGAGNLANSPAAFQISLNTVSQRPVPRYKSSLGARAGSD